ncbi:hypothetical protein SNEBB_000264 [Seison nebaliae]|nr:hypothetical protein SNEBB_000264 [Seison nebaliae]
MINGHLLLPWNQNGMVSTLQTRLNSPNESGIYSLEEANNIHNGDNTNHNSKTSKCRLKKFYSIGKGRQSRRDRTQSRNKSCDSSNKNSNENQGINQNQILYKTIRTQSLDNYLSTENNSGNPLAHNVILLNNDGTTFIPQKMPQIALGTIYNGNQLVSYVPQKTQDGNTILVPQPIMNSVVVQNNNQNLEGCNIDNNPNTHTYTQVQPNVSRPAVLPLSAYHSTNMSHLVSSTSANAPPFHLPQTQLNNSSSSDCNSKNSDTSCYDYVTKDFYTIFDKNQNNKQFTEIFHNNNPQATPQNLPNKQMNNPNFNSNDSTESSTETDLFQLSSNSSNKKANENEHVIPLIPSICDDGQSNSKNGNWNKISCEPSIV